jgi:WD40 repeat protein
MWDLQAHREFATLDGRATSIAVTPENQVIFCMDGRIGVWDIKMGSKPEMLTTDDEVEDIAITYDGSEIVAAISDKVWANPRSLKVYDLLSGQELGLLNGFVTNFGIGKGERDIALEPSAKSGRSGDQLRKESYLRVVSASPAEPVLRVWDIISSDQDHPLVQSTNEDTFGLSRSVVVTKDGRIAAFAGNNGLRIYDIEGRQLKTTLYPDSNI